MNTTTKAIWWDGSMTTCVEHMGFTLKSEIEAHPRRKTHNTCFGQAYLMTDAEIAELQTILETDEVCETCSYQVRSNA